MILNSAYGHKGIEHAIKNIRCNGDAKEKEELSKKMYAKLGADFGKYKTLLDDVFGSLGDRVSKVYRRPVFAVLSNGNALIEIGTSYLLLSKVGCISINIVPFRGVVTGCEKDKSWFLWGRKTYCEIDSPLYKYNSEFVTKLQESIKMCMSTSKDEEAKMLSHMWYVRNIVAFTTNDVYITDERNETNPSSQVTSVNRVIDLVCNYIDTLYNRKSSEEKETLKKAQIRLEKFLDSILVENKEFIASATPRTPIPVIFEDDEQEVESIKSSSESQVTMELFVSKVKGLSGVSVEDLASKLNQELENTANKVKDVKFSGDLLSCIVLYK